ncbi:NACHT domain-containing protein [Actinokineospora inagensis]|uniref:NACHT domain-containing protein n=1 Tax=Actinokineospora inagensis TaxID=103730 RepID=UPI0006857903|nr:NACHT domain-containing protein [Actinokineospora inagensis]
MDLTEAVDRLAGAVRKQWRDEVARRSLNDPYPLPVSWGPAPADLVAEWGAIARLAEHGAGWLRPKDGWAAGPDELAGSDGGLVDVWRKVPTGRLVVLGEPGAGKTMLLARFVVDLLGARASGDPVPVLVSVASWDPRGRDLRRWLTERLAVDHPALATGERPLFEALVDNGSIIVVLDGLDEVPEPLRALALAGVNEMLDGDQPLILSCRTADYRAAARPDGGAGVTLTGAAGVQLRPLDVKDVIGYLRSSAGGPASELRWLPVEEALWAGGVLSEVLVTPLMTTLARVIYNTGPADPAELVALPDRQSVEQHLFDGYLPAAYRDHPSRRSRWTSDDAQRWLGFLAHYLETDRSGSPNLAWWRLRAPARVPWWQAAVLVVVMAVVAGCAAALLFSMANKTPFLMGVAFPVACTVVLTAASAWWLTGRFVDVVVVVAVAGGLIANLSDFSDIRGMWLPPSLLIVVGLAVGLIRPLRENLPNALVVVVVVTVVAFLVYGLPYVQNLPVSVVAYFVADGSLAMGTLAMVAMSLAGRSPGFPAWCAYAVVVAATRLALSSPEPLEEEPALAVRLGIGLIAVACCLVLLGRSRRGIGIVLLPLATLVVNAFLVPGGFTSMDAVLVAGMSFAAAVALGRGHVLESTEVQPWARRPVLVGLGAGVLCNAYYPVQYALTAGLFVGLAVELVARRRPDAGPAQRIRFAYRAFPLGAGVFGILTFMLLPRLADAYSSIAAAMIAAVAVAFVYGVDAPRLITAVRSPREVFKRDRAVFRACVVVVAVVVAAAIGLAVTDLTIGIVGGVLYGLPAGVVVGASRTRWFQYAVARAKLRRELPWRLIDFLADAHEVHGVLRQDGATYQFRHLDLQRRLAATCAVGRAG